MESCNVIQINNKKKNPKHIPYLWTCLFLLILSEPDQHQFEIGQLQNFAGFTAADNPLTYSDDDDNDDFL